MNKKNNKCPLLCGIEVDAYRLEWIGQEHKGPAGRAVFASLGRVGGRGKHWQTVDRWTDRQEDERWRRRSTSQTAGWLAGGGGGGWRGPAHSRVNNPFVR